MADDALGAAEPRAFPAATYEDVTWDGDRSQIPRSRRAAFSDAYRAVVTPEIADLRSIPLDADVAAIADEATREVTRFDAELGGEIAPFGAMLLRSESAASSQIENLTASAKAIGVAELDESNRQNANLIVANVRSMQAAIELSERLDGAAIIEMHRQLLEAVDPRIAGRWRTQQVWVGGSRWGPHDASHVAPRHERVQHAMDDLVAFMARNDLPTLPQIAIAHGQFEIVHPFPDGNGRTGRALLHAMLRAKGVTRAVTVPVSAGLLGDAGGYFAALAAQRDGDPNPIVRSVAEAAFAAIGNGRHLVADLADARERWDDAISARSDAVIWRIADHLVAQPVVTSKVLQAAVGGSPPAVAGALDRLASLGIVSNLTGKARNRVWVADEIVAALDAFAERAGRRG